MWIVVYQRLWENAWLGFKSIPARGNYRLYALENEEGRLIGEVELDHICWKRREAELRIRIGEKPYWNRGYGTLALREILEKAFLISGWTPFIYGFTLLTGVRFIVMKRWAFAKEAF